MKLSMKLYLGFGVMVLLLAFGAANSFWAISSLDKAGSQAIQAGDSASFLVAKEVDHVKWASKVMSLFIHNDKELHVTIDHTKCGLGKFLYGPDAKELAKTSPQLAALLEKIKEPHARLHASAAKIGKLWKQNHPGLSLTLAQRLDDHRRWAEELTAAIMRNEDVKVQMDPKKCAFGKWLASEEAERLRKDWPKFDEIITEVVTYHDSLHGSAAKIKKEVTPEARKEIFFMETQPALRKVAELFGQIQGREASFDSAQVAARKVFDTETKEALSETSGILAKLVDLVKGQARAAGQTMKSTAQETTWVAGLLAAIGILLGIMLAFFITRAITKPINRVVEGLSTGSEQVAAASSQVSSSSQSLAEGASEQASALEETSASLEELASMTRQNADNAQQADGLMQDASKVVAEANQSMSQLKEAMDKITSASDETAKIIKTIDEIAFQTNLLALNAAVEAARAGEAGAGFAVVADEVRNLAMRAAEAAKTTSSLIEENLENIKVGSEMVTATDESFGEVVTNAQKVGELVGEIAAASTEQAQGIDQITKAANEMEKVTQQVAANAEESAAASEELSAQAQTMNGHVDDLVGMVNGKKATSGAAPLGSDDGSGWRGERRALPGPRADRSRTKGRRFQDGRGQAPEDVIPLDDSDFADF